MLSKFPLNGPTILTGLRQILAFSYRYLQNLSKPFLLRTHFRTQPQLHSLDYLGDRLRISSSKPSVWFLIPGLPKPLNQNYLVRLQSPPPPSNINLTLPPFYFLLFVNSCWRSPQGSMIEEIPPSMILPIAVSLPLFPHCRGFAYLVVGYVHTPSTAIF